MIKILFVTNNEFNSGAFRSMTELCIKLKRTGEYKIIVVCNGKKCPKGFFESKEIQAYYIPMYSWTKRLNETWLLGNIKILLKRILNVYADIKAKSIIKKERPDIVHINDIGTPIGAKLAIIYEIPLVWHIRVFLEEGLKKNITKSSYKLINKATAIICISQAQKEAYKTKFDNDKLIVIKNGIDINRFYFFNREILNHKKVEFINVGGMVQGKGQDLIIEAAKVLIEKNCIDYHITLIGNGVNESLLKQKVKDYNLNQYISFEDNQSDIEEYYSKSDSYIMSSNYEGFGRVTVEAMLSGCIVIGSDSGATTEILGEGRYGLLFKNADYNDLVNKMLYVINNRIESKKIALKGQEYAFNEFSIENTTNNIDQLYSKCVNNQMGD